MKREERGWGEVPRDSRPSDQGSPAGQPRPPEPVSVFRGAAAREARDDGPACIHRGKGEREREKEQEGTSLEGPGRRERNGTSRKSSHDDDDIAADNRPPPIARGLSSSTRSKRDPKTMHLQSPAGGQESVIHERPQGRARGDICSLLGISEKNYAFALPLSKQHCIVF